jgi:hypothetical protein
MAVSTKLNSRVIADVFGKVAGRVDYSQIPNFRYLLYSFGINFLIHPME